MTAVRCVFAAQIPTYTERPCAMHSHACTEIVCYLEGSGYMDQKRKRSYYQPGYAAVYQPGLEHNDIPQSDGSQLCVGVSGCGAKKLTPGMWKIDESIKQCIQNILHEISNTMKQNSQERLDILSGWLVLELHRIIGGKNSRKNSSGHVDTVKKILDSRFNEQIDLQELAGSLYINPDYLRHIFKQELGESPLNYLIRKRLDSACEMLSLSDLAVGKIACRVGLENAYYFSRIFRKRLGMTPTEYRKKTRNKTVKPAEG